MRTIITSLTLLLISMGGLALAQYDDNFEIIPEETSSTEVTTMVENVGGEGGSVWDNYKRESQNSDDDLGNQLASGVMTWDTLLNYVTYLVRFIGQLALLIGALMIIYAGYKKATEMFKFQNNRVTAVIKGIIVIAFAYAIIRILVSMFIS